MTMSLPKPNGGFAWTQEAWGPALRCLALLEIAPHLFTTRQLALRGEGHQAAAGWNSVAAAIGAAPDRLVRPRQVHGTAVILVSRHRRITLQDRELLEADIVVTDDPSTGAAVQMADCVPLLVADPRSGAVAAVHSGWRGTAAGAAGAAVAAMRSTFHANPADLVAAIGPSIGPCCYEVGEALTEAFRQAGHASRDIERWFRASGGLRLDLWQANRDQLEAAGLGPDRIHVAGLCTATHRDLFHSYRRDGPSAGRLAAAIRPRG
jgi:polyphenol oxidase